MNKHERTRFLVDTQDIPRDPHSTGVHVLAAGLWRCATSSLQTAFETSLTPNFAPSMHGAYVMPSVQVMQLCCKACRETDVERRRHMLRTIFTGYNASSDYPGMAFVDDLVGMFPDIKVVLNKRRSALAWSKSARESLKFFSTRTYMLTTFWVPQSYWHYRVYADYAILAKRRFGTEDIWSVDFYEKHNQWVRDVCAANKQPLLEWEPAMGWDSLCAFLGHDVPGQPFPQVNEGEAIAKLKRYLILRGLATWALAFAVVVVPLLIIYNTLWPDGGLPSDFGDLSP